MIDYKTFSKRVECKINIKTNFNETTKASCKILIGCVMYIMVCTRPDLSFTVKYSCKLTNKNQSVIVVLKRVLRRVY